MSKSTKNSAGIIIATLILIVPIFIFISYIIQIASLLLGIVMIPVILYIWSLVGSSIGMMVIGLFSPSYANNILKQLNFEFPDCLKLSSYWITLCVSILYVIFSVYICKEENIHKAPSSEKFIWFFKCAFFFVLPFVGLFRISR
jgi:hypothetical protein